MDLREPRQRETLAVRAQVPVAQAQHAQRPEPLGVRSTSLRPLAKRQIPLATCWRGAKKIKRLLKLMTDLVVRLLSYRAVGNSDNVVIDLTRGDADDPIDLVTPEQSSEKSDMEFDAAESGNHTSDDGFPSVEGSKDSWSISSESFAAPEAQADTLAPLSSGLRDLVESISGCAQRVYDLLKSVKHQLPSQENLQLLAKAIAAKFILATHASQPFNYDSIQNILHQLRTLEDPISGREVVLDMIPYEIIVFSLLDYKYICDNIGGTSVTHLPIIRYLEFVRAIRATRLSDVENPMMRAEVDFGSPPGEELGNQIGKGSFGQVRICRRPDIDRHKRMVVKIFQRAIDPNHGLEDTMIREVCIAREKFHRNLIEYKDVRVVETDGRFHLRIYMEFMQDLHALCVLHKDNATKFDIADVRKIMKEILQGVNFLHENHILHRDLKPQNILIDDENTVKIADLGLATYRIHGLGLYNMTGEVVTRWYRAPEVIIPFRPDKPNAANYTSAVDIFSIGCIFVELCVLHAWLRSKNDMDQLRLTFEAVGAPPVDSYIRNLGAHAGINIPAFDENEFGNLYMPEGAGREKENLMTYIQRKGGFDQRDAATIVEIVAQMTRPDPSHRITATECLKYFSQW